MFSQKRENASGFTLIELMIVVAIISILSAMALPMLREARMAGNESNTISAFRTLTGAEEIHIQRTGTYGTIGQMEARGYLDESFQMTPRQGYVYAAAGVIDNVGWSFSADPDVPNFSGVRYFFTDQSGVIRSSLTGTADGTSKPID